MSGNKHSIPMSPEYMMLLFDDGFPGSRIGIFPLTVGMRLQFQPTLVIFVHRIPKGGRVAGMDQYRNMKGPAFLPDGIKPGASTGILLPLSSLHSLPRPLLFFNPPLPS